MVISKKEQVEYDKQKENVDKVLYDAWQRKTWQGLWPWRMGGTHGCGGDAGGNAFPEENSRSYPDAKKQAAVLGTDAVLKLSI